MKAYPSYTKGKSTFNVKLKPKDKATLKRFLRLCEGSAGERKVKNYERIMLQIYDATGVSYDEWDLKVLRDFLALLNKSDKLPSTKNDVKKVLKRFLRENYEDWNTRFKEFKDPGLKQGKEVNHQKLNPTTMLKPGDIDMLLRRSESLKWKAYISLAWASAGRPEELLKLKWNDYILEKGKIKLHSSKTGNVRVLPINEAVVHLKRYKQAYPFPNIKAEDYLFPSPNNRNSHITTAGVHSYLKTLGKKTINRPIFSYLFRHGKLSILHKKLSPKSYEYFADHSIATAVKHYSHLGADDLMEEMYEKVFKIEELTEEDKQEIKNLNKRIDNFEDVLKKLLVKDVKEIHLMSGKIKNPQKMDIIKLSNLIVDNQERASKEFLK